MKALLGLPVGLLLGFVIHRGDFCMHSAVREAIAGARGQQVRAYLMALGFLFLTVNGLAASESSGCPSRQLRQRPRSLEAWSSAWGWWRARAEPHRFGPGSGPVAWVPVPQRSDSPSVQPSPATVRSSQ